MDGYIPGDELGDPAGEGDLSVTIEMAIWTRMGYNFGTAEKAADCLREFRARYPSEDDYYCVLKIEEGHWDIFHKESAQ